MLHHSYIYIELYTQPIRLTRFIYICYIYLTCSLAFYKTEYFIRSHFFWLKPQYILVINWGFRVYNVFEHCFVLLLIKVGMLEKQLLIMCNVKKFVFKTFCILKFNLKVFIVLVHINLNNLNLMEMKQLLCILCYFMLF